MTQSQAVLDYIETYGSITTMQAFSELGITRLAARISDLRKVGHKLKATPMYSTNRYGRTVRLCKYSKEDEE